jgi:hypothetical protein
MANDYGSNPIYLDVFSAAIDVGDTMFGDSQARFKLQSIEWQEPTTAGHTAVVTDGDGNPIFDETCITNNQSVIKYFDGRWVSGLKVAANGVSSGKITISYY